MEYDKNICPVVKIDGIITTGKQFDLDITLPKDNRNVIYGIVRDENKEPVYNAVIKRPDNIYIIPITALKN